MRNKIDWAFYRWGVRLKDLGERKGSNLIIRIGYKLMRK